MGRVGDDDALIAGRVLAHFRLEREIGEGATARVWSAVDTETHARVALKIVKSELRNALALRPRALREARAAMAIRHPNVLRAHELFELEEGWPVIVMELLTGETLGSYLAAAGRLSAAVLAELLVPVLAAVGAAHALGIVHRDLKPENIFVCDATADGDTLAKRVRVLDFGIAKLTRSTEPDALAPTQTDVVGVVGTPYYMSPEQVDCGDIDSRSDIWSLGVIAYECLAGVRPTEGPNTWQVFRRIMQADFPPLKRASPGTPTRLAALVDRMLRVDRNERPQSVGEIAAVLERFVAEGHPPSSREAPHDTTRPVAGGTSAPKKAPPRRALEAVAAATMLAIAVWGAQRAPGERPSEKRDSNAGAASPAAALEASNRGPLTPEPSTPIALPGSAAVPAPELSDASSRATPSAHPPRPVQRAPAPKPAASTSRATLPNPPPSSDEPRNPVAPPGKGLIDVVPY